MKKWGYMALLLVLTISLTSVLWAADEPYTTSEAKRIGSQAASDAQKAATESVKEALTSEEAAKETATATEGMVGMSKSDIKQMTDQNIGHIARTLSMMTEDMSKMSKGEYAKELSAASSKLKSMSERMTGSRMFGSSISADELKDVSKSINDCVLKMESEKSEASKTAMDADMRQASKMFKAHAALLAGNLANFAGYLNMLAMSGGGEMRISQSQTDMFMRESTRLMSEVQAFTAGTMSESGMIGAMDANDANSTKDANSMSSGMYGKSSTSNIGTSSTGTSSTSPMTSKSTMLGSSMDTTVASKVTKVLDDSSRLMKNMAGALTGEQATAMSDLGDITNDISKLRTACMRQHGMSPSTNIGSSDVGAETESGGMSGRTGTGVGAGTGSVSGARDIGSSGNTAGSSTGSGAEIGKRTYDANNKKW